MAKKRQAKLTPKPPSPKLGVWVRDPRPHTNGWRLEVSGGHWASVSWLSGSRAFPGVDARPSGWVFATSVRVAQRVPVIRSEPFNDWLDAQVAARAALASDLEAVIRAAQAGLADLANNPNPEAEKPQ